MFEDRAQAGRLLAKLLKAIDLENPLILALPRGGVPVARPIADSLGAPLDILAVRKIGAPYNPELAIGAIGEDGSPVLNQKMIEALDLKKDDVDDIIKGEWREIKRQLSLFRSQRPTLDYAGRNIIVVDDGLATGATAAAAVRYLKNHGAGRVVLAVPVAAKSSAARLRRRADDVICVEEPEDFLAVGHFYADFSPVSDQEVITNLNESLKMNRTKSAGRNSRGVTARAPKSKVTEL